MGLKYRKAIFAIYMYNVCSLGSAGAEEAGGQSTKVRWEGVQCVQVQLL